MCDFDLEDIFGTDNYIKWNELTLEEQKEYEELQIECDRDRFY